MFLQLVYRAVSDICTHVVLEIMFFSSHFGFSKPLCDNGDGDAASYGPEDDKHLIQRKQLFLTALIGNVMRYNIYSPTGLQRVNDDRG